MNNRTPSTQLIVHTYDHTRILYEYKSKRLSITCVIKRVRHILYTCINNLVLTLTLNSEFSIDDIINNSFKKYVMVTC